MYCFVINVNKFVRVNKFIAKYTILVPGPGTQAEILEMPKRAIKDRSSINRVVLLIVLLESPPAALWNIF